MVNLMTYGQRFHRLCRIALVTSMGLSLPAVHAAEPHVRLEFFGAEGCPDCATVKLAVLPGLQQGWGDRVEIVRREIDRFFPLT